MFSYANTFCSHEYIIFSFYCLFTQSSVREKEHCCDISYFGLAFLYFLEVFMSSSYTPEFSLRGKYDDELKDRNNCNEISKLPKVASLHPHSSATCLARRTEPTKTIGFPYSYCAPRTKRNWPWPLTLVHWGQLQAIVWDVKYSFWNEITYAFLSIGLNS